MSLNPLNVALANARADRARFAGVLASLDGFAGDPQAVARLRVMGVDADATLTRFKARVDSAAERHPHPLLQAIRGELEATQRIVADIRERLDRRAVPS